MDEKQKQLKKWIDESDNIVFFGGAGVSTVHLQIPPFFYIIGSFLSDDFLPLF